MSAIFRGGNSHKRQTNIPSRIVQVKGIRGPNNVPLNETLQEMQKLQKLSMLLKIVKTVKNCQNLQDF